MPETHYGDLQDANAVIAYNPDGSWIGTPNSQNTIGLTSTLSNVNSSASSTSLLASNTARKGATFANDSTAILYLKFGATASTSSYTIAIPAQQYYELPQYNAQIYKGAIDGIWASANGAVRITELT